MTAVLGNKCLAPHAEDISALNIYYNGPTQFKNSPCFQSWCRFEVAEEIPFYRSYRASNCQPIVHHLQRTEKWSRDIHVVHNVHGVLDCFNGGSSNLLSRHEEPPSPPQPQGAHSGLYIRLNSSDFSPGRRHCISNCQREAHRDKLRVQEERSSPFAGGRSGRGRRRVPQVGEHV